MDSCDCVGAQWFSDELLAKYQYLSDFIAAVAYFSIPLELIFFVIKSAFFPYKWVLIQFGTFIVLCGATHLITLWTFSMHSKTVAVVLSIAKMCTAVVSGMTAVMLAHLIPDVLTARIRELFLKRRADELDREMGIALTQEETGRRVRMLTHEIRSTLDRDAILETTLVELGRTLGLAECALWMPCLTSVTLRLSHALQKLIPIGSTVTMSIPVVSEIFSSPVVVRLPQACPLFKFKPVVRGVVAAQAVAIRVPLLNMPTFQLDDWPNVSGRIYAILVLVLPADGVRKFREHELDLIEVVADQVAVALSHAALLEESVRARDQLAEQNRALERAQREAEMATRSRNDLLAVMNDQMRMPLHALLTLSALLMETVLNPEHRMMIETILRTSNALVRLISDLLGLSRLDDGRLELESEPFNLLEALAKVIDSVKEMADLKGIGLTLTVAPEVPTNAVGDGKVFIQTVLNIVGNAVKFTRVGGVSVVASLTRPGAIRDRGPVSLSAASEGGHFHLRVKVKDTGCGISQEELPHVFDRFTRRQRGRRANSHVGLGLAICQRFVNLMGGHITVQSEGPERGTLVNCVVKLGIGENSDEELVQETLSSSEFLLEGT